MRNLTLLVVLTFGAAAFADEPRVNLQTKDADVRDVLKSLQDQCGIKNLVIDPDVQGKGACLVLKKVPCSTAFRVVFKQYGLTGKVDQNVTTVEKRKD